MDEIIAGVILLGIVLFCLAGRYAPPATNHYFPKFRWFLPGIILVFIGIAFSAPCSGLKTLKDQYKNETTGALSLVLSHR